MPTGNFTVPMQYSIFFESASIYSSEEECQVARYELHETYNNKSTEYKSALIMDSYCVEFESFPIAGLGLNKTGV